MFPAVGIAATLLAMPVGEHQAFRRRVEPSVGMAWDGLEARSADGDPAGRLALATFAGPGAPGETRTPNPQIRSLDGLALARNPGTSVDGTKAPDYAQARSIQAL